MFSTSAYCLSPSNSSGDGNCGGDNNSGGSGNDSSEGSNRVIGYLPGEECELEDEEGVEDLEIDLDINLEESWLDLIKSLFDLADLL